MDQAYYEVVVTACALVPDLQLFPAGDQTEIGENGINISGGQKQRIALARAVYSQADIYLLDDTLSAVDPKIAKHIFGHVIGPAGLLAEKTRLLITHGISHLPECDVIYVMLHGGLTEWGGYEQLIQQKGAFADFMLQHRSEGGAYNSTMPKD